MSYTRLILYCTVFITGAAVLIMEVAAVRMLAPYFGSSLFVFSSILTVVLFALSLGYYFGGKFSDKHPYHIPLYSIITLSGLSLLGLTLIATYSLPHIAPDTSLGIGPLFVSIIFFLLPAFLLGIDSPYVIKLLSKDISIDESGRIVGSTFFWSTAGSITGSLMAGFFLIPTFGLKTTMSGTAVILIILGIVGGLLIRNLLRKEGQYDSRNNTKLRKPIIMAIFATMLMIYILFEHTLYTNIVFEKHGYYSHIVIFDDEFEGRPTRFLKRDINNSSAIFLEDDELVYRYTQFADFFPAIKPEGKRFLMLGGGAYTIPRKLNLDYPELQIDTVEIEPILFELAQEFFRLPKTEKIINHLMDARVFLRQNSEKYDWIFIDIFNTGFYVPPHLVTKEFFELLEDSLAEDGAVFINFIAKVENHGERSLIGSFSKTLMDVFPHVELYVMNKDKNLTNLIYVVSKKDSVSNLLPSKLTVRTKDDSIKIKNLRKEPTDTINNKDTVFTDDKNPVESLLFKERFIY